MSHPVQETGLRKQLTKLTERHDELARAAEEHLNRLNRQIQAQTEVINALVRVIGAEETKEAMEAIRAEQRAAAEARQVEALNDLKAKNILIPQDVVADDSVVVVKETLPDGRVNREQYRLDAIQEDAKALFLGKKVGETLSYQGVGIEVTEIYRFDQARADEALKEEQAKTAAAETPVAN